MVGVLIVIFGLNLVSGRGGFPGQFSIALQACPGVGLVAVASVTGLATVHGLAVFRLLSAVAPALAAAAFSAAVGLVGYDYLLGSQSKCCSMRLWRSSLPGLRRIVSFQCASRPHFPGAAPRALATTASCGFRPKCE